MFVKHNRGLFKTEVHVGFFEKYLYVHKYLLYRLQKNNVLAYRATALFPILEAYLRHTLRPWPLARCSF